MRIRLKTQLAFFGIGLLPLLLFAWFSLDKTAEMLTLRSLEQLTSVALLQEKRVESIIAQNLEQLNLVLSRTQLRINLSRYGHEPNETHRLGMLRILNDAKSSLRSFQELTILGLDGRVIVSTEPNRSDSDLSGESSFQEGLRQVQAHTFTTDAEGRLVALLSGPLVLEKTLGVLVIQSSAEDFQSVAHSFEGLGSTGETIVLLRAGQEMIQYLTTPRFIARAAMAPVPVQEDGSELLRTAFTGAEQVLHDATDYRGHPVLAVTRQIDLNRLIIDHSDKQVEGHTPMYSPPNRMALVIKIDQSEAFAPIKRLTAMTILMLGFTLAAVLIVSLLLSNSITRPLRDLSRTATEISEGNLDKRAQVEGNDEITFLARDFNAMARGLTEANRHLEEKVAERTRDLHSSQERYALAVKGSTDGLWDWNVTENAVSYSDRFKELLGYEPQEFEDSTEAWKNRLHPEDKDVTLAAVKAHLEDGEPYDVEYRLRCRDESYRWFRARGLAVRDATGVAVRMAGSISDVTARKQAVENLRRSNKDLEQFAYVASHDLQEPLRMISSYMQILNQRYRSKLDPSAGEFIDFAVDGASRMQRLISDLLLYSRVDTRVRELVPVDTGTVLTTALANLRVSIENRSATVQSTELPIVDGDETQLVQLFQNLLANALKFCPPDRHPEIDLSSKLLKHRWLFRIRDNGIGIDPEQSQQIFEIFKRLHSREAYEGTGIGLAICQKIVERHGGRIWVESQPGEGSTFCFTLPEASQHG